MESPQPASAPGSDFKIRTRGDYVIAGELLHKLISRFKELTLEQIEFAKDLASKIAECRIDQLG